MPVMDGYEVCRRLKSNPELRPIPVIMVSAGNTDDDVIAGLDAGADDYVSKPFSARIVESRVRSALRVKELHDECIRSNELLEEAKQAAEAANQAKSEFLSNMSHEIRTPMTAILGFTEVLAGNVTEPENVDAVKTIAHNGRHLLEVLNDILDLSKIESGKLCVEQLECSPCQVLADVASLMRVRASAKSLPLEVEYEGPIPCTIQSDPTRLRQILINLLGNAIKFTKSGKIRVVTRLVDTQSDQPKIQFDVIDTGIGMTEEQVGKLFQPFVQADSSTTRNFGGTGMGLTISIRLAEMLGGDVQVRSAAGEGSTFSATVSTGPLKGLKLLDSPNEIESSTSQVFKRTDDEDTRLDCRVLLAEDGPDNQRLISFILKWIPARSASQSGCGSWYALRSRPTR